MRSIKLLPLQLVLSDGAALPVAVVGVQHVVPELAFERVGQLVQPSSLLRMGLMSIASAAKMTVISEQVDATVDRFIGILSFRRQKSRPGVLDKAATA